MLAIKVTNLSKRYRIGVEEKPAQNPWQVVRSLASSPFKYLGRMLRPPTEEETIWALKDVSFEVKKGEVVGIIGRNGAGKSTLLKILSRITEPTEGRVEMYGRVGSLLEVGTGFHSELTGRENIYLSGAILGMKKAEIDRKFDEIVAFAGVEKFIDTPVKRYSSGMYVRLAFAVAAHLETEILLVDEVLAVGDAEFQKKCLGKMGGVAKEGRTVLFVSHNMGAVKGLCSEGIILDDGRILYKSNIQNVVGKYLSFIENRNERIKPLITENAEIINIQLCDEKGKVLEHIDTDTDIYVTIKYKIKREKQINIVINLSKDGQFVFQSINNHEPMFHKKKSPGIYKSICHIPAGFLNNGRFVFGMTLFEENYSNPNDFRDIFSFMVQDAPSVRGDYFGGLLGCIRPKLKWETIKLCSK